MPKSLIRDNEELSQPIIWLTSNSKAGHAYLFLEYIGHQQSYLNFFGSNTHYLEVAHLTTGYFGVNIIFEQHDTSSLKTLKEKTINAVAHKCDGDTLNMVRNLIKKAQSNPPGGYALFGGNTNTPFEGSHNCISFLIAILKQAKIKVNESWLNNIVVLPGNNTIDNWGNYLLHLLNPSSPESIVTTAATRKNP